MPERHRLTITVTMALYEELCVLAGPRRLSQWMEEAAWAKIHSPAAGMLTESDDDPGEHGVSPLDGLAAAPWCWSPLLPRQAVESSEDLLDL